ncbi:hypothetical protein [Salinispora arenicola]|uniref:hypothetical protein n=1 Tax=Salinispora arenicola TaxID=168697 RepID=UPI0027DBE3B8|nr:hypothetical protein [Salinispora arenicola]
MIVNSLMVVADLTTLGPVTAVATPGILRVLSDRTEFRWLWLGNLISVCGGWFSAVAVFAMVYHHTGAGLAAAPRSPCGTCPASSSEASPASSPTGWTAVRSWW